MTTSLGEQLLAARTKKQAGYERALEVPGWEGRLWAIYRPLDFREARRIGQRHERLTDEVEKELRVAADTLVAACVRCEAHIPGADVQELPPLGLELCQQIGLDGPETPIQAVLEVFPSEMALVRQFLEVQELEVDSNGQIDGQLEGNSEAVVG